jgi:hypothetical protein
LRVAFSRVPVVALSGRRASARDRRVAPRAPRVDRRVVSTFFDARRVSSRRHGARDARIVAVWRCVARR